MRFLTQYFLCGAVMVFSILPSGAGNAKGEFPQSKKADVFVPISKYIQNGDTENLSAWFADNLEIRILGSGGACSRAQAKRILKNFFAKYNPKSFVILHKSGNSSMRYAIGTLLAGGENFRVTLLVRAAPSSPELLRIKIERPTAFTTSELIYMRAN